MKKYSEELKTLVYHRKIKKTISNYVRKGSNLLTLLINETNFLINSPSTMERLYYVEHDIFYQLKCEICQKPTSIEYLKKTYKIKTCSVKCACQVVNSKTGLTKSQQTANNAKITRLIIDEKTGLNINQQIGKIGNLTKLKIDENTGSNIYGVITRKRHITMSKINQDSNLTKFEETALKSANTMCKIDELTGLSKYDIINKKTKITMSKIDELTGLSKYDTMGHKVKKRKFKNILENFPNTYTLLTTLDEYLQKFNFIKYKCNKCNKEIISDRNYIRCTKCFPYNKSVSENEIIGYCQSLSNNVVSNNRQIIKPLELDIYLPDNNIAIEYDGLFWHSSYSVETEDKEYHLHKTKECEKQRIQLFHIFENEWENPIKQEIWKSIIRNRLGKSRRIYARKTEVSLVNSKDKTIFLNDNHLQGTCQSSVNIGLYLDNELVSLMTFGRSRYKKEIDWELLRFCNKIGYSVIGGASKLLMNFRKEHEGSIISYADKRRSNGNLYKQLGFEFSHESKPNYFYFKSLKHGLESRIKYQKHKLKNILEIFDSKLTESENMYNNKFRKIYDCGNQVWILN